MHLAKRSPHKIENSVVLLALERSLLRQLQPGTPGREPKALAVGD